MAAESRCSKPRTRRPTRRSLRADGERAICFRRTASAGRPAALLNNRHCGNLGLDKILPGDVGLMPRKRVTVVDLATKVAAKSLYARVMNPNLASIMPQAIAAWCEELGHDVTYVCYTGFED